MFETVRRCGCRSRVDLPRVPVIQQEYNLPDKMKTVKHLANNLQEVVFQNTKRLWSSKCIFFKEHQ